MFLHKIKNLAPLTLREYSELIFGPLIHAKSMVARGINDIFHPKSGNFFPHPGVQRALYSSFRRLAIVHTQNLSRMRSEVDSTLQGIRLGQPVVFKNMAMVPLFDGPETTFSYLTMKGALAKGFVEITEVSEGGSVPNLKVINHGDQPVLLLDGEEVKGAKQNRIINTSILLAPKGKNGDPRQLYRTGALQFTTAALSANRATLCRRTHASQIRTGVCQPDEPEGL